MLYSIESIENGLVTLAGDDERTVIVPVSQMAQAPRPGQLVRRGTDGIYRPDEAVAKRRRSRILHLLQELKTKSAESSDDHKNI